jgi:3-hydroxyacyl-[acyl-carrier-protein] dehydratase
MKDLHLGPDVIARLILHRRPFVMIDHVLAYARTPHPTLHGSRMISANEPVFDGHFPGFHLWPGVYTIEGMAQATNVLFVLEAIFGEYEKHGLAEADAIADLENLERSFTLAPRFDQNRAKTFLANLAEGPSRGGMAAAVDVELLKPVFAGQKLEYRVAITHTIESMARCEVSAEVAGELVAKGTLSSVLGLPIPR